jgi:hypothetical protein
MEEYTSDSEEGFDLADDRCNHQPNQSLRLNQTSILSLPFRGAMQIMPVEEIWRNLRICSGTLAVKQPEALGELR